MDTNLVAHHVVLRGGDAALTPTGRITPWDEPPGFPGRCVARRRAASLIERKLARATEGGQPGLRGGTFPETFSLLPGLAPC